MQGEKKEGDGLLEVRCSMGNSILADSENGGPAKTGTLWQTLSLVFEA